MGWLADTPSANVTLTVLEVSLRYRSHYLTLATPTVTIQSMDVHEICIIDYGTRNARSKSSVINDNGKAESTPEMVCWTKIKHSEPTSYHISKICICFVQAYSFPWLPLPTTLLHISPGKKLEVNCLVWTSLSLVFPSSTSNPFRYSFLWISLN